TGLAPAASTGLDPSSAGSAWAPSTGPNRKRHEPRAGGKAASIRSRSRRPDDERAERRRPQYLESHRLDAVPAGGETHRYSADEIVARVRRRSVNSDHRGRNAADG